MKDIDLIAKITFIFYKKPPLTYSVVNGRPVNADVSMWGNQYLKGRIEIKITPGKYYKILNSFGLVKYAAEHASTDGRNVWITELIAEHIIK